MRLTLVVRGVSISMSHRITPGHSEQGLLLSQKFIVIDLGSLFLCTTTGTSGLELIVMLCLLIFIFDILTKTFHAEDVESAEDMLGGDGFFTVAFAYVVSLRGEKLDKFCATGHDEFAGVGSETDVETGRNFVGKLVDGSFRKCDI